MPAAGVVPELDVVVDRGGELDPRLPAAAVEQLDLHPPPEALHQRVVVGRADRAHRRRDAGLGEVVAEGPRGELHPAIAMHHQPVAVRAPLGGHPQRVEHEAGGLGGVDRPAHDLAAEGVQHHAAVDLALAGGVLGDVGDPQLVGAIAAELAPDQVQRRDLRSLAPRGSRRRGSPFSPSWRMMSPTALWPTLIPRPNLQLGGDPQRAVGAAGLLVDVGDLAGQPDPAQRPRRVGAILPGVVARLRDPQRDAGLLHVDPCPVRDSITG